MEIGNEDRSLESNAKKARDDQRRRSDVTTERDKQDEAKPKLKAGAKSALLEVSYESIPVVPFGQPFFIPRLLQVPQMKPHFSTLGDDFAHPVPLGGRSSIPATYFPYHPYPADGGGVAALRQVAGLANVPAIQAQLALAVRSSRCHARTAAIRINTNDLAVGVPVREGVSDRGLTAGPGDPFIDLEKPRKQHSDDGKCQNERAQHRM